MNKALLLITQKTQVNVMSARFIVVIKTTDTGPGLASR